MVEVNAVFRLEFVAWSLNLCATSKKMKARSRHIAILSKMDLNFPEYNKYLTEVSLQMAASNKSVLTSISS